MTDTGIDTVPADALVDPPAPDATEPADLLADLLAADPPAELSDADRADIVLLDQLKQQKRWHEESAKAIGKDVTRIQTRLIELAVELGLIDDRGRIALGGVDNGRGFTVTPYERRTIWPAYRVDPATDQPYERDALLSALRRADLGHLVVETTHQFDWPGYVRERVKAWRKRTGQSGITDSQGRFVDHDGHVLDADEAQDPTADILALPRAVRAVVEPVDKIELQFTRRQVAPPSIPASDPVACWLAGEIPGPDGTKLGDPPSDAG